MESDFEWDDNKNFSNQKKHGVSFEDAQDIFNDTRRIIIHDMAHSTKDEPRYYCVGKNSEGILTVRFIWRKKKIRIIGAGYWRKGRKLYETQKD